MSSEQASEQAYDEWHALRSQDDVADGPWHRLIQERLKPGDLEGKRILEIGCGRGGFTVWLASQGPREVVAADFSPVAVEMTAKLSAKNGLGNVTTTVQDIEHMSFADGEFDIAISCETIEHVPHPWIATQELHRVLKPGGTLVLTTPNYLGMMGLYRIYLRLRGRKFTEVGQPINQFTMVPRTARWLRKAGFRVSAIAGVGHFFPFPGRPPLRWMAPDHWPLCKYIAHHSMFWCQRGG